MSMKALVEPLRRVALFQGLSPMQITEIARRAERVIFKPGETIIEEGEAGDCAYIVVGGDAERTQGPDMTRGPEPVVAGSLIGEMAMLVETEHTSTVIARSAVRALRVTRAQMTEHMTLDPTIADHLVGKITMRLHSIAGELRAIDGALPPLPPDMQGAQARPSRNWPDGDYSSALQ